MRGAKNLIAESRIDVIQFEYNWLWIEAGIFLKDTFEYLISNCYQVGKITPQGIQFRSEYHHLMETFEEANYVACTDKWHAVMPKVPY